MRIRLTGEVIKASRDSEGAFMRAAAEEWAGIIQHMAEDEERAMLIWMRQYPEAIRYPEGI